MATNGEATSEGTREGKAKFAAFANALVALGLWGTVGYFYASPLLKTAINVGDVAIYGILGVYYAWVASRVWGADPSALRRSVRVNVLVFVFSVAHLVYARTQLAKFGVTGDAVFVILARIRVPVILLHAIAAASAYAARERA